MKVVLQQSVWASDMELYIPDANKVIEVEPNRKGHLVWKKVPWGQKTIFSEKTGELLYPILSPKRVSRYRQFCHICLSHPLLNQSTTPA
jgi:hypothetical protein